MARSKRTNRTALTGGKLALFEVLQAAQTRGSSQLSDAVAPIVAPGAAERLSAPAKPTIVVAEPAPAVNEPPPAPTQSMPLEQALARRRVGRASQSEGVSLIAFATAVAGVIALSGAGLIAWQHYSGRTPHAVIGTPPMPEVLDVGGSATSSPTYARPADQTRTQAVAQAPASPAVVPPDFRRVNGLNYVVVQSYDPREEELAVAARDALLKNGVGATIETGIDGWGRRLCVVGTDGFEQVRSNAKYEAYRQRLMEISASATAADKRIRKFEPTGKQWERN